MQSDEKNNVPNVKEVDFNGAAVIDARGREIAITEDMIQSAFDKLLQVSMLPAKLR
ncbi:MAG: hypothetical protein OEM38_05695 [Gammaproteobacteria bacterium]|nr:hypothetical protein [Gammaproteobacteria bacterium]